MKGSLSAADLTNPKPGLPLVHHKNTLNPIPVKRPDSSLGPPIQNPDIVRKALGKVVDQDYYEGRPVDGMAFNAANYSKKRLIMKNKHKFPSDFFNSTKRNSFSSPDESFNKRQNSNIVQQAGSKVLNVEGTKDTESSFLTVFGFSHSDHRYTHETPKFSSEAFANTHGDEINLKKSKSNNADIMPKDNFNPTSALEGIRKLDLTRMRTAFLPNSRTLGSLTERITGSNELIPRKVNIYGKKLADDVSIGSPEVFPDIERNFPQDLLSKLSSPEQKTSGYSQSETNNKSVQTAPEKKKRSVIVTNKMLTDLALMRKKPTDEASKEIQSALPRIKQSLDVLDQNAASSRTKLGGLQNQNYFRYEDTAIKCFDLRNKQGDASEERKGESSPLPSLHRKNSIDTSTRKVRPYQIVTQVSSTTIKHETTSICKTSREIISHFGDSSDQEDKSPGRKKHTSLDNKIERFYGASNLKCKDPRKNDEERERSKSRAHKRYSSMDIEHILTKTSKKKESVNESKTSTGERQSKSVMRERRVKEHKKHVSMEIQKDLVETYKVHHDGSNRSKTASRHKDAREKVRGAGLKRQMTPNQSGKESARGDARESATTEGKRRARLDQQSQELKPEGKANQSNEAAAVSGSGNLLSVSNFEARMRGFTFAKIDFECGENKPSSRGNERKGN